MNDWLARTCADVERLGPTGADTEMTMQRAARVAWSCIVEPGDSTAGALLAAMSAAEAWRAFAAGLTAAELASVASVSTTEAQKAIQRWKPRLVTAVIDDAIGAALRNRVRVVTPDDVVWPSGLVDLDVHAPVCLWVSGSVARLAASEAVAIVGARAASSYGELVSGELAAGIARENVSVVSGAAYGIDGAAHRGALAAGGATIAYLAGGCDRAYPSGHTDLLDRIRRVGAVVSEVPCGTAPTKWRFLQRNRLIAATTSATIVVEAGVRSGSLNTAGHAATLGRGLGAVPGPVTSPASAGCHHLLREYDAVCITGAEHVLELLGRATDTLDIAGEVRHPHRVRLLDALPVRGSADVERLAVRSGLSVDDVRVELGMMLLSGEAEPTESGWRRTRTNT